MNRISNFIDSQDIQTQVDSQPPSTVHSQDAPSHPDSLSDSHPSCLCASVPSCLPHSLPHARLLSDYLHSRRDLLAIAMYHDIPIDEFIEWLESPETQSQIEALTRLAEQRERAVSTQARVTGINRLSQLAFENPEPVDLPHHIAERRRETARKAADRLARLSAKPQKPRRKLPSQNRARQEASSPPDLSHARQEAPSAYSHPKTPTPDLHLPQLPSSKSQISDFPSPSPLARRWALQDAQRSNRKSHKPKTDAARKQSTNTLPSQHPNGSHKPPTKTRGHQQNGTHKNPQNNPTSRPNKNEQANPEPTATPRQKQATRATKQTRGPPCS